MVFSHPKNHGKSRFTAVSELFIAVDFEILALYTNLN